MAKIIFLFYIIQLFFALQLISISAATFTHHVKRVQRFGAGLLLAGTLSPISAHAFGPLGMPLSNIRYEQVEVSVWCQNSCKYKLLCHEINLLGISLLQLCDGKPPIMPGQKAMEGLYPACVEVHATIENPSDKTMKDVRYIPHHLKRITLRDQRI